uniref:DOMON domain-containing protein n=1 Tax=Leersia perrieri TaxID=77586 RepID=A0A0D9XFB0_9ORYZ
MARILLLPVALLLVTAASPASSAEASVCGGEKFPAGKSYATCADLPTLGATLHWTHDAATSTLSVAFVATPPPANGGGGWVSWAINPTGDGMKGAQALLAMKGVSASYIVKTYNITGYKPLPATSTPIAFAATDLAADGDGGSGKVRLYGKLRLPAGMETVNHIWQVGSTVTGGVPMKHAFAEENLDSKGRINLSGHGGAAAVEAPAPAPVAGGPSSGEAENAVAAPSPSGKNAAANTASPAMMMMIMALVGLLAFV